MDIQKIAKDLYCNQKIDTSFTFVGGFLINENIIVVVVNKLSNIGGELFTYIYELKNDKWEYFASPKLDYLWENLNDFLPAKKRFLIEVEVNTAAGDRKPDEAIKNFIDNQNNNGWTEGEILKFKLVGSTKE